MTKAAIINCEGLSTTLTVLRIKQALVTAAEQKTLPLKVSVDNMCDREQLKQSLGLQADIVQLV